ncbi:MAG: hypothetical protein M3174_00995, partial [Actinomycetota bacterium]|nr:hypothetical protein [Actinomycetota bacterium]
MPEIDNDLFNLLVVALLAISTLLLLALLSALSGIRKVLRQQLDETSDLRDELSRAATTSGAPQPTREEADVEESPEPAPASEPIVGGAAAASAAASSPAPATQRPEPVAWEPEDERPPAGVGATDTSGPEDPFATPAADDPFASSTPATSSDDPFAARSSTDDTAGVAEDDP